MKPYIIQIRVNPTDEWIKYKQFDNINKAKQSLEMLKKHNFNLFKGSEYDKYRLFNSVENIYIY